MMEHCRACSALWLGGSDDTQFMTATSNHKVTTFWNWRNNHRVDLGAYWAHSETDLRKNSIDHLISISPYSLFLLQFILLPLGTDTDTVRGSGQQYRETKLTIFFFVLKTKMGKAVEPEVLGQLCRGISLRKSSW